MLIRTALAAMLFTPALSGAAAQEYDDPAVAICEFDFFGGGNPPAGYTRLSSAIEGQNVSLRYSMQMLNLPPVEHSIECTFETDGDGRFVLTPETSPSSATCSEMLDRIRRQELRTFEYSDVRRCEEILQSDINSRLARISRLAPLVEYGYYPIDPDATTMMAE